MKGLIAEDELEKEYYGKGLKNYRTIKKNNEKIYGNLHGRGNVFFIDNDKLYLDYFCATQHYEGEILIEIIDE